MCVGDTCEKQCSIGGKQCLSVERVQRGRDLNNDLCTDIFRRTKTSHLCIDAEADAAQVAEELAEDVQGAVRQLTPSTAFQNTASCRNAIATLACFRFSRSCNPATDIELPLCLDACTSYKLECGLPPDDDTCSDDIYRSSGPCSGPRGSETVSRQKRRTIIALATLFSLMLLLFVLLYLFCARATRDWFWLCHHRRWRRAELDAVQAEEGRRTRSAAVASDAAGSGTEGGYGMPSSTGTRAASGSPVRSGLNGHAGTGEAPGARAWVRWFANPLRWHTPPPSARTPAVGSPLRHGPAPATAVCSSTQAPVYHARIRCQADLAAQYLRSFNSTKGTRAPRSLCLRTTAADFITSV